MQLVRSVNEETRHDRGALLRSYERNVEKPPQLAARLQAKWPTWRQARSRRCCITETVNEYSEKVTTVRTAPAAWPTIGVGGRWPSLKPRRCSALSPAFSDAPHTEVIDASGRYGASNRQRATWSGFTGLAIGLPVVALGVWERSRGFWDQADDWAGHGGGRLARRSVRRAPWGRHRPAH